MALELAIVGLRRSGTTIVWKTLRQDPAFRCFDEPFNPKLYLLPDADPAGQSPIKEADAYLELFGENPAAFWEHYAPIHYNEELLPQLSDRQCAYLQWLGASADRVLVDVTRCQFKLEALHRTAPETVVVHLHRAPASVVTSHLLPNSNHPRFRTRVKLELEKRDFWTRRDRYGNWFFEQIIGAHPGSVFGDRLREIGLDPEEVYRLPAVGKLLAFWRINYERAERTGREHYGDRFVSIRFEDFCARPQEALAPVYEALGRPMPELDLRSIRSARPPHQADNPRWDELAQAVGLGSVAAKAV